MPDKNQRIGQCNNGTSTYHAMNTGGTHKRMRRKNRPMVVGMRTFGRTESGAGHQERAYAANGAMVPEAADPGVPASSGGGSTRPLSRLMRRTQISHTISTSNMMSACQM